MAEISIPSYAPSRIRTRTYDFKNTPESVLTALLEIACPAGSIIPTFAAAEPGEGWKICNGQALLKADFPRLYAVIGGTYGETATAFNLPDLRGRMPYGANGTVGLGATGGAAQVTLDLTQVPAHSHGVTDPGHGHTFTGSPHSHTVTDPGHDHTAQVASGTAAAGGANNMAADGTTGSNTTGVTVDPATAGGTVGGNTTGISIDPAGGGAPVDILPPVIGVNWMVRT